MLKIVTVPNPVLNNKVKNVEKFDLSLKNLVGEMEETLKAQVNPQGVGLAAPQIGFEIALFIVKISEKSNPETFINAKIIKLEYREKVSKSPNSVAIENMKKKSKIKTKLEGCLSMPRIWGPVKRAKKVYLEYQDLTGNKHKRWFSGFKAVVIQHETDHLNGILFSQRVLEQKGKLFEEKEGKLKRIGI